MDTKTGEMDLFGWIKYFYSRRKVILIIVSIFSICSIFIAFTTPKVYTVSTRMIANASSSSPDIGGSLGGLASLAGIDINSNSGSGSEIPPILYPKIVESAPFKMKLINSPLLDMEGNTINYYDYYNDLKKRGPLSSIVSLPSAILSLFKKSDSTIELAPRVIDYDTISRITYEDYNLLQSFSKEIGLSVGKKDGIITMTVSLQSPELAAQISYRAQQILKEQVTTYKVAQAKEQFKYTEQLFIEKEKEFLDAQSELSRYLDRNQNISTAVGRNDLDLLETKFDITSSVFLEISKQLESAKIKVSEETPSFSIIEPAVVPLIHSSPSKGLTILGGTALGLILSLMLITIKLLISQLKTATPNESSL